MTKLQIYSKLANCIKLTHAELAFLGDLLLQQDELLSKAVVALEVARSGTEYHEGRNAVYTIIETKDEIQNYIGAKQR